MRKEEAKLQDKFIALLKKENILYYKTSGGMSWYPTGKNKIVEKEPVNKEKKEYIEKKLNIKDFKIEVLEPDYMQVIHKKGFSDIIVFTGLPMIGYDCLEQKTYFIELKTDTGQLRDSQKEKFQKLTILGFDCYILRPKHWEKAKLKGKLSFNNLLNEMEKYNV